MRLYGKWYRRAYFDDGTPLVSKENIECRMDSIAQSWSVLSGAADPERSRMAMEAVDKHLVRREDKLIHLLDPPFDKSELNPGYIKGYVPGVRETAFNTPTRPSGRQWPSPAWMYRLIVESLLGLSLEGK